MIRALLITLVGASVLSCLIVPILFELLTYFIGSTPWPFSRVFDRVFLIVLALFIVYFRRDFDLESIRRALAVPPVWRQRLQLVFLGACISAGTVALCMIGVFAEGTLTVNPRSGSEIFMRLAKLIPGALFIAFAEELFFRVLLLQRLRHYLPLWGALVLCSLVYAVVHFITPQRSFIYHGESWLEGFNYIPALLQRLGEPGTEIGIAGLFIVGLLLAFAMVRIGSVYLAIGLHGGWICAQKMISYVSLRDMSAPLPAGLGGRYSLFGEEWTWLSFLLVMILLGVLAWGRQRRGWMVYS